MFKMNETIFNKVFLKSDHRPLKYVLLLIYMQQVFFNSKGINDGPIHFPGGQLVIATLGVSEDGLFSGKAFPDKTEIAKQNNDPTCLFPQFCFQQVN